MAEILSVPPSRRVERYTMTGGEIDMPVPWPIFGAGDIRVVRRRAGLDTTLTLDIDYLVTGSGGGAATVTLALPALAGDLIVIVGALAIQRVSAYVESGDFTAAAINADLDRGVIWAQENRREIASAIRYPETDLVSGLLPDASTRAGRIYAHDSAGNPILSGWPATAAGQAIENVAGLRAAVAPELDVLTSGTATVHVQGYWRAGDGGGGLFYWEAGSLIPDDGGYTIRPVSVAEGAPGRWRRRDRTPINVRYFGADPSLDDNRTAFQAAFDAARPFDSLADQLAIPPSPPPLRPGGEDLVEVLVPPGAYRISGMLYANRSMRLRGSGLDLTTLFFGPKIEGVVQPLPEGDDCIRAARSVINGTAFSVSDIKLVGPAGAGGAVLSIRGGARCSIDRVLISADTSAGSIDNKSSGLRLINSQDIHVNNLTIVNIGDSDLPFTYGSALSIYYDAELEGSIRPNNIYINDCRFEDCRSSAICAVNANGIYVRGGKIDGSFGSLVVNTVPAIILANTFDFKVEGGFIAGMKGPALVINGYSSAFFSGTKITPGRDCAIVEGAPQYAEPSTLAGYRAGNFLTPSVTFRGVDVRLSSANSSNRCDAVFAIKQPDYIHLSGMVVTARAYSASTGTTSITLTKPSGWNNGANSVMGRFLVDRTSGARWLVRGNSASTEVADQVVIILSGDQRVIPNGAAMQIEWSVHGSCPLAIMDGSIVHPEMQRETDEYPRLHRELYSGVLLASPTWDAAAFRTEVAVPDLTLSGASLSGCYLINTNNKKHYKIENNSTGSTIYLAYNKVSDITAEIANGDRYDIRTGIDTTVRLLGDMALWSSSGSLRYGTYPVTDWESGAI